MVTLLDCIKRVSPIIDDILDHHKEHLAGLMEYLEDKLDGLNEIVFVGSGTSNFTAMTSKSFVEKASGLKTTVIPPSEFCYNTFVYNPYALYVFTTQSGTTLLVNRGLDKMVERGYATVSITEKPDSRAARVSGANVVMGFDKEEWGMSTIGYCSTVLTQMLMGMAIGLGRGHITREQYETYIADARRVPPNHKKIVEKTMAWFDRNKYQLLKSTSFVIFGSGPLWGTAVEGALKLEEIAGVLTVGFEMEEGLHGPTTAFHHENCVLSLNSGGLENDKALLIGEFVKKEKGNGFVIGQNVNDEKDLQFDVVGGDFRVLEFAPVVEVLGYRLAVDAGIDLAKLTFPEMKYFFTQKAE